jgi:hypothetical protein
MTRAKKPIKSEKPLLHEAFMEALESKIFVRTCSIQHALAGGL